MLSRGRNLFRLCLPLAASFVCAAQSSHPPEDLPPVTFSIRMRDGVLLAADLYLPHAEPGARLPAILVRTPYNRKNPNTRTYLTFRHAGYAVLIEDVRGRFESKGQFGYISQEGPDGNDTINWIAAQPWSNGRVGMVGGSYLGLTQWWAAVQNNPHLFAISPMCSGDDDYSDRFYSPGGAMQLGHRLLWIAENLKPSTRLPFPPGFYLNHLPLRTSDLFSAGRPLPIWRGSLDHPSYDAYWKALSIREQLKQVHTAVLSFGGWFDTYAESDLDAFRSLALQHKPVETWIGPWGHDWTRTFDTVNFGHEAQIPQRFIQTNWFDRWVKNPAKPRPQPPLLHIFVTGPNIWREEHEWPLNRTRYTPLYLASQGDANSAQGDGVLRWQPILKSPADTFTYDPKNPVPTMGGAVCCNPRAFPPGPLDQQTVEKRDDVLVYTSAPLNEEMEVTGALRTILYVATSANDTDFTSKLVDVSPNGQPLLVTDGIQRLRYRLSLDTPVFVKRNQAYQISIDTGVTSHVFETGHRIRVEISSSNFPRFDRNLNSSAPNADITKINKAKQTVFHEKGYPSAIILPIIPREGRNRVLLSHTR